MGACRWLATLAVLLVFWARPTFAARNGAIRPRDVPSVFATVNYGVMARFPPGLTYCPMSDSWIGSDHGTEVYLTPPSGCYPSDSYPSSGRGPVTFAPTISLYYGYLGDVEVGSYLGPPRTVAELAILNCDRLGAAPIPSGLTLLGKPAEGCRYDHGDQIEIRVFQLYDIYDKDRGEGASDGELDLTLVTNRARLDRDLSVFKTVTSRISLCTPFGEKPLTRAACPPGHWF